VKTFACGSYAVSISVDSKYIACFSPYKLTIYEIESSAKLFETKLSNWYHLPKFSSVVPNLLLYVDITIHAICGILVEERGCKKFQWVHDRLKKSKAHGYRATFSGNGRYYIIGTDTIVGLFEMHEKYWQKAHLGDQIFRNLNKSAFIDLNIVYE
jgi:hypothetical protein